MYQPRVLRVSNIPLNSKGIGLKSVIRRACQKELDNYVPQQETDNASVASSSLTGQRVVNEQQFDNDMWSPNDVDGQQEDVVPKELSCAASSTSTSVSRSFQVMFERTVHARVQHGAAFVICASPAIAAFLHQSLSRPSTSSSSFQNSESEDHATHHCSAIVYEGNTLQVDYAAGKLRDHLFSKLPYEVRREMRLDPEASFSVTDDESADRMSQLLRVFWHQRTEVQFRVDDDSSRRRGAVVMDAMACVGGNTLSFAKYLIQDKKHASKMKEDADLFVSHVMAIEQDPIRCRLLKENIELSNIPFASNSVTPIVDNTISVDKPLSVLEGSVGPFLNPKSVNRQPFVDILFWDPPWGGPQYAAKLAELGGDLPLALDGHAEVTSVGPLLLQLCGNTDGVFPFAPIIAVKLPSSSSLLSTAFAAQLTSAPPYRHHHHAENKERNFPFRFHFGLHTTLLVVLVAGDTRMSDVHQTSTTPEAVRPLWFCNAQLDDLVSRVMEWHEKIGFGEHRPEYYDYDKKRWIMLKKWISSAESAKHRRPRE